MNIFFTKYFKGDPIIWVMFFCLMAVSALEMFSASSRLAYDSHNWHGHYLGPILGHLKHLVMGFAAAFIIHRAKPKWIFMVGSLGYIICLFLLGYVLLKGGGINGAARWINLPIIGNFQPSEASKLVTILTLAFWMGKFKGSGDVDKGLRKPWFPYFIVIFLQAGLIFFENLSTFLLLTASSFIVLFVGGVSLKKLGKSVGVLLLIAVVCLGSLYVVERFSATDESGMITENNGKVSSKSSRKITHRFDTWANRVSGFFGNTDKTEEEKDAEKFSITGKQEQTGHCHIAVARGKWFGCGIGASEERDFIPQSFADFIYAIIVEEVGVFALLVLVFYIVIFTRSCMILNKSKSYRNALVSIGLSSVIVLQAFMHVAVNLGFMPVTGQTLPLISRGGTSILITSVYFGVLLAMSNVNVDDEVEKKAEKKVAKRSEKQSDLKAETTDEAKGVRMTSKLVTD